MKMLHTEKAGLSFAVVKTLVDTVFASVLFPDNL